MDTEKRSQWLADQLRDLMATPYVQVDEEEGMGPGPVDMFSTKFDAMFMPDAHGWVCGERTDRDGIKESLLGLQRRWNEKEAKCQQSTPQNMNSMNFHVRTDIGMSDPDRANVAVDSPTWRSRSS